MQIKKLTKGLYNDYEFFLHSVKEGMFFYSIKYKLFLEKSLKCEDNYWIALENNQIIGILPMMKKAGKYGDVYNSLPFYGSNGGVLSHSEKATQLLINEFNKISNLPNTAVNLFISNPLIKNYDLLPSYDLVDTRIGQFTSIKYNNNKSENLMNSFHSKTRNMVRKAQKSEVKIYIDNNDVDFLEQIHKENMNAIGGIAKKHSFFSLIPSNFKGNLDYNIFIAKKDNEKIAALLLFYYNDIVEYFTPVVKGEYRNLQPVSLLIYEAMIKASNKGFKLWNWGGTWLSQDGVYKFKNKFGAEDKEYKYYIKINNKNIYNATKEQLLNEYSNFYTIPYDKLRD